MIESMEIDAQAEYIEYLAFQKAFSRPDSSNPGRVELITRFIKTQEETYRILEFREKTLDVEIPRKWRRWCEARRDL